MMYTSSYALLLASDCEGALERLFESELKFIWTNNELIQNIPLKDERYEGEMSTSSIAFTYFICYNNLKSGDVFLVQI